MMALLETNGLGKQFRTGEVVVDALQEVDFRVERGEFVAIMGPSGSGKSTLLHLLGALDQPSAGSILLDGKSLADFNDDERTLLRRRELGFVFQFFNLLPSLSAAENVALPLLLDGVEPTQAMDRANELLALVDLDARGGHRPDQLSGGEQQRTAIARAMSSNPSLLFADEPTGNLDRASGQRLLGTLRRACDEQGQTVVMVTHDPFAASFADRVVFLRDGRVVQTLTGASLTLKDIAETAARLERPDEEGLQAG
jgi:putative ABC transport system ATP-binding protein